jgi:hypothetical protein
LPQSRAVGMRVFYFHEDGYGTGGSADITRELHGERHGHPLDDSFSVTFSSRRWPLRTSISNTTGHTLY